MSDTEILSAAAFLRGLAEYADMLAIGTDASVATLNEGVTQRTGACHDAETLRKHRARLRAALLAMAREMGL